MAGVISAVRENPPGELRAPLITGALLALVVAALTLTPIIFILLNSLNVARPGESWQFGLEGWREVFQSSRTLNAIGYSFLLAVRTAIGIAVAFVFSWLLIRVRIPFARFIEFSLWIAYFLPPLPMALSWILLLDPNYGLLNQLFQIAHFKLSIYSVYGILWVHLTTSTIPLMTILLTPALRQMDGSLEEAARVCGAGYLQTFKRILIPVLTPALLTIVLASVVRNLEAFEIEQLLGKPAGIYVYATRIYDLIQWEPPLFAQAMSLSTLFLVILVLLALFYQHYSSRRSFATISGRGVSFRPTDIGRGRYAISGFLLLFLSLSVFLPLAFLLIGASMKLFGYFNVSGPFSGRHWLLVLNDPQFLLGVRNSFLVGLGTAGVGIILYSLLGYALLRARLAGKPLINLLIWLPWAVPGILLGLAFLWLFLSVPILTPLYGTFGGLILVLLLKEMPIGVHMVKAGFVQLAEELEQVARVCGAGWLSTYWRITLPLILPTLVSIFAIVFVSAIRDISAIILISTSATRPLSLLMMEYSLANQMEAASIIGVILSLFGIGVAFISRRLGIRLGT
jgi:iron(III) transport system permease protein